MKRRFSVKRLLACLMILAMLPLAALAEEYQAKVTASKMNIYSTNRVGNNFFLGSLAKGVEFTVTATSGDWARISYQGRMGFAKLSDMEKMGGTSAGIKEVDYDVEVKSSTMKVYSTNVASNTYLIGTLAKGTKLKVTAMSGDWSRISYQGRTGFAKTSDMQLASAGNNENNNNKVTETNYTAEVTSSSMRVYSTNNASNTYYLGSLKKGIQFTVTATSGDWARISYNGNTGFAKLSDMKKVEQKINYMNVAAEVKSQTMRVYSSNNTDSKYYLGSLGKGVQFTVTATSGDWARISYQGRIGFAKLSDMQKVAASVDWTEFQAKVSSSSMKVYSTNNASNAYYLGSLSKGVQFTVTATSGEWARIKHNGNVGFAKISDMEKTTEAFDKTMVYANRQTKIYSSASTGSRALDTITADFPLYVLAESGNFYQVTPTNGNTVGYVRKAHVSASRTNPLEVSPAYKGSYSSNNSSTSIPDKVKSSQYAVSASMSKASYLEYIIYAAQTRIGCAYSSAPNNSTTFRNLSFVRTCFGVLDIKVPASYEAMNGGTMVNRANLKRGDILCFDCDRNGVIDHVGIYLGNNYFIHASNAAGMVVVTRLTSSYYSDAFRFGRRILG